MATMFGQPPKQSFVQPQQQPTVQNKMMNQQRGLGPRMQPGGMMPKPGGISQGMNQQGPMTRPRSPVPIGGPPIGNRGGPAFNAQGPQLSQPQVQPGGSYSQFPQLEGGFTGRTGMNTQEWRGPWSGPQMPRMVETPGLNDFYEKQKAAGMQFPQIMDAWKAQQNARSPEQRIQDNMAMLGQMGGGLNLTAPKLGVQKATDGGMQEALPMDMIGGPPAGWQKPQNPTLDETRQYYGGKMPFEMQGPGPVEPMGGGGGWFGKGFGGPMLEQGGIGPQNPMIMQNLMQRRMMRGPVNSPMGQNIY